MLRDLLDRARYPSLGSQRLVPGEPAGFCYGQCAHSDLSQISIFEFILRAHPGVSGISRSRRTLHVHESPGWFLADGLAALKRNHYDRVIHFAFGLLLLYPMRELLIRSAGAKRSWAPWLAAAVLWALSSYFEI